MTYSMVVTVTEMNPDFPPPHLNLEPYTRVVFAVQLPTISTPQLSSLAWKHIMQIFVPREKWDNQYKMWEKYHLTVRDDGSVELKKVNATNGAR